jgi:hypothetical protein
MHVHVSLLVIWKHKRILPVSDREQGGAGSNYGWTNNDAQGIHPYGKRGFEKAVLVYFTIYYQ